MPVTPGRSTAFNVPQLAVETTAGTAVACNRRLQASAIRMRPMIPTQEFRPSGGRFATDSTNQKEWMQGEIQNNRINLGGDINYWLSTLLMKAAVAGTWVYKPDTYNPNQIETLTLERGTGATGERSAYAICDSLEFAISTEAADVRGTLLGRALSAGITVATSGVTVVPKALAIPGKVSIKVGDTSANLVKITEGTQFGLSIGRVHRPQFYLDDAQDSFSKLIAVPPALSMRLTMENGSVAAGILSDLRSSAQKFIEVIQYGPSTGALPGPSTPFSFKFEAPFKYSEEDMTDEDDLDVAQFGLRPVHDATFGAAFALTLVNGQAAL